MGRTRGGSGHAGKIRVRRNGLAWNLNGQAFAAEDVSI